MALQAPSGVRRSSRHETGRSRKGCVECRKRKIKCDESQPQCGHCRKRNQPCSVIDSLFRPHPFTFSAPPSESSKQRREAGPSPNEFSSNVSALGRATDVSVTRTDANCQHLEGAVEEHNSWEGTWSHDVPIESPESGGPAPEQEPLYETPIDDVQLGAGVKSPKTAHIFDSLRAGQASPQQPSSLRSASENVPSADILTPEASAYSLHNVKQSSGGTSAQDTAKQDCDEIAFFMRHYSGGVGEGMDLFVHDRYFSRQALLVARGSDLVKFAACAAAAKQLGHMKHPGRQTKPTDAAHVMSRTLKANGRNYLWYGAKYYGKAIQSMAAEISQTTSNTSTDMSPPELPWEVVSPGTPSAMQGSSEARLMAASIMCQYEKLSASTRAWGRHLNGIYKLLQLDRTELLILQSKKSLRSLFWCFVQNDFEHSYITNEHVRMDTANIPLWREMGLPLDNSGRFNQNCMATNSTTEHSDEDEIALRAILRLMCKLVNHIVSTARADASLQNAAIIRSDADSTAISAWTDLKNEFDDWLSALPRSFQPDIVRRRAISNEGHPTSEVFANEVWFANSQCSVGLMYYHMAMILLFVHQPSLLVTHGTSDWLHTYRSFRKELLKHVGALLAIALGAPDDAVRMHMLQPLYVAGRCMTREADQRRLVEMLESIENDVGVATGYHVKALIEEWGTCEECPLRRNSGLDHELSDLSSTCEE